MGFFKEDFIIIWALSLKVIKSATQKSVTLFVKTYLLGDFQGSCIPWFFPGFEQLDSRLLRRIADEDEC